MIKFKFFYYFISEIYYAKKTEDLRANSLEVNEFVSKDEKIKFKPYVWH
jgi:hypothetical protein